MKNYKIFFKKKPETHFFKQPSILIKIIKKNKNSPRERERERAHSFVWEKYGLNRENDIKFIKIKQVEEESKYKKDEGSVMVKQWGHKEAKRRENVGRSVTVSVN